MRAPSSRPRCRGRSWWSIASVARESTIANAELRMPTPPTRPVPLSPRVARRSGPAGQRQGSLTWLRRRTQTQQSPLRQPRPRAWRALGPAVRTRQAQRTLELLPQPRRQLRLPPLPSWSSERLLAPKRRRHADAARCQRPHARRQSRRRYLLRPSHRRSHPSTPATPRRGRACAGARASSAASCQIARAAGTTRAPPGAAGGVVSEPKSCNVDACAFARVCLRACVCEKDDCGSWKEAATTPSSTATPHCHSPACGRSRRLRHPRAPAAGPPLPGPRLPRARCGATPARAAMQCALFFFAFWLLTHFCFARAQTNPTICESHQNAFKKRGCMRNAPSKTFTAKNNRNGASEATFRARVVKKCSGV